MSNYYLESRDKQKRITRIVVTILVFIITLLIIMKISKFNNDNYNDTEAIVTSSSVSSQEGNSDYVVSYKYTVNGEEYTGTYWEKVIFLVPKEGQTIKIKYSKNNVGISKINQFSRIKKHLIVILIFILIGVIFYRIKYNRMPM